ncbi:MAG: VanW family protein [Negativicutes bacterium]|jgi:vancomycin resistance protein YoaR
MKKLFLTQLVITTLCLLALTFSGLVIGSVYSGLYATDKIAFGVTVADVDVGGLTVDEAAEKFRPLLQEKLNEPLLTIKCQDKVWKINKDDIDFSLPAANQLASKAYATGKNIYTRQTVYHYCFFTEPVINCELNSVFSMDTLKAKLDKIALEINVPAKSASILMKNSALVVDRESLGLKVDVASSMDLCVAKLKTNLNDKIDLVTQKDIPIISEKNFVDINSILSETKTQVDPNNVLRIKNIELAASKINQTLVEPDKFFSFNNSVGLRTVEAGFENAPVVVDNDIVDGIGGGICQVSSTLYNAVLEAGLQVKERAAHALVPKYVPPGQDATVADNLIDFKFTNNYKHSIYIVSNYENYILTIRILGNKNDKSADFNILTDQKAIENTVTYVRNTRLPAGAVEVIDSGHKGFLVQKYRIAQINGVEISREHLGTDIYEPQNRIIAIGEGY